MSNNLLAGCLKRHKLPLGIAIDLSYHLAIVFTQKVQEFEPIMKLGRYVVYYSGRVQGVGFRYAVCRIAAGLDVKGFVRNLPDGRVQLIAEGRIAQLDLFLESIQAQMSDNILGKHLDRQEPRGEFSDFQLR